MENDLRYSRDLVLTRNGYFGLTNQNEAEEGLLIALVGGARDLVLLREKTEGDVTWYEFVDRIFLNYLSEVVEQLNDIHGNTMVQGLEIR
jgi:hypothetical protein